MTASVVQTLLETQKRLNAELKRAMTPLPGHDDLMDASIYTFQIVSLGFSVTIPEGDALRLSLMEALDECAQQS